MIAEQPDGLTRPVVECSSVKEAKGRIELMDSRTGTVYFDRQAWLYHGTSRSDLTTFGLSRNGGSW